MKKLIAAALVLLLLAALFAGCSGEKNNPSDTASKPDTTAAKPETTAPVTTEAPTTETPTTEAPTTEAPVEDLSMEEVLAQVNENMKNISSMRMSAEYAMKMNLKIQGMEMALDMEGTMEGEGTKEPYASHMKSETSYMGQNSTDESYSFREDGKTVLYTWDEDQNAFVRSVSETEEDPEDDMFQFTDIIDLEKGEWEMESTDTQYILKGKIKASDMSSSVPIGEITGEEEESAETEEILLPVTVTVDKATMYITAISFDMNEYIAQAMEQSAEQFGEGTEVEASMVMDMFFSDFNADITINPPENFVEEEAD